MQDRKSNRLLVIVIVMQSLVLAGQWLNGSLVSSAQAQIPDGGAQRQQTIDALKSIDAKLEHIGAILESGKLQVRTVAADAKHD